MDWNSLLLFLHIIAFVFWLGTDVGVFVLGKFAQDSQHGIESRLLLLKVAMILDMAPRIALVVSVYTGFQIASNYGLLQLPGIFQVIVSCFCLFWLGIVFAGFALNEKPGFMTVKLIEKACLFVTLVTILAGVAEYFIAAEVVMAFWLMVKLALFASIIIAMFLLEPAFMPAVLGFQQLATQGSSPDLEHSIRSAMDKTYIWVIAIYIAVVISAIFGVFKFT